MTSHDEGLRTLKPSFSLDESNNRILRGYCGAKELSSLGPLHIGPKAYVEEEETPEDEQRESKLPRDIAEDDPVLGQPKS